MCPYRSLSQSVMETLGSHFQVTWPDIGVRPDWGEEEETELFLHLIQMSHKTMFWASIFIKIQPAGTRFYNYCSNYCSSGTLACHIITLFYQKPLVWWTTSQALSSVLLPQWPDREVILDLTSLWLQKDLKLVVQTTNGEAEGGF